MFSKLLVQSLGLVALMVGSILGADGSQTTKGSSIRQALQRRIQRTPQDASNWRLMGRLLWKEGEENQAADAFQRAVNLDPTSAAAHFDSARFWAEHQDHARAREHFQKAVGLAPQSDYAAQARRWLQEHGFDDDSIRPAGYEIRSFDGSEQDESIDRLATDTKTELPSLHFRLEGGVLYNTNIALAPTSRNLSSQEMEGFQGFLSPTMEYHLWQSGVWRAGPTFNGYFNLNEDQFRSFNLQSYQPGAFVERDIWIDDLLFIPRIQYSFTHDEFNGNTFANRHGLNTSLGTYWQNGDISLLYWSIDHTNFQNEGASPSLTSQDGWMNTLGLSHTFFLDRPFLYSLRLGADYQHADLEGSSFRFRGVSLYGEIESPLTETCSLIWEGGWGFRHYPDFQFSPSRDEHIWRAGLKLRKFWRPDLFSDVVFNYQRFDSRNNLFTADRLLGGLVLTYLY